MRLRIKFWRLGCVHHAFFFLRSPSCPTLWRHSITCVDRDDQPASALWLFYATSAYFTAKFVRFRIDQSHSRVSRATAFAVNQLPAKQVAIQGRSWLHIVFACETQQHVILLRHAILSQSRLAWQFVADFFLRSTKRTRYALIIKQTEKFPGRPAPTSNRGVLKA